MMKTTPTPTASNAISKTKNLGVVALVLKLILMLLIIITICLAYAGIFLSMGGRQIDEIDKTEKNTALKAAAAPLVIILISSVLQCVVFCYKGRTTAFKVIVFGDVFLCTVGFGLLVFVGVMLIYGSGKHCDKREFLNWDASGGDLEDINLEAPFRERLDEIFEPIRVSYAEAPDEDLLLFKIKAGSESAGSTLLNYREKCSKRWGSVNKIAAGSVGIFGGLLFVAIAVLGVMQGIAKNPEPQNAAVFQQGAYQPGGAPIVSSSPSYVAAYPDYQPPSSGIPQSTLGYESATPSQYQFQQGPQGYPSYGPAQPQQQEYLPSGPQFVYLQQQQGYQTQGPPPQPQGPLPQ